LSSSSFFHWMVFNQKKKKTTTWEVMRCCPLCRGVVLVKPKMTTMHK
jgi:hypothetical protein